VTSSHSPEVEKHLVVIAESIPSALRFIGRRFAMMGLRATRGNYLISLTVERCIPASHFLSGAIYLPSCHIPANLTTVRAGSQERECMMMKTIAACLIAFLPSTVCADAQQIPAQDLVRIERTNDGHSVVTLGVPLSEEGGGLVATFDFSETKGFLGSSANPSQSGFASADKTLIAVNHQPMTKSSYVHLFLRALDVDLTFLNNVNGRVARLLGGRWAESAKYFLRVESISGRKVTLQTVDLGRDGEKYQFTVTVNPNGSISLP
jgi:hypothetical protein